MNAHTVQLCRFCVLDSSIPGLKFDETGQCTCCKSALERKSSEWFVGKEGERKTADMLDTLKQAGAGRQYDALIGLSGGIDSAYLAHHVVKNLGLRVLAVHVDAGWNTEAATRNIESIVRRLNIDLVTQVIEWDEVRRMQLAFLRASVLNQDIPQDHAFFVTLYRTAAKYQVRHFLSGVNFSSESVIVPSFGYPAMDGVHVSRIYERFSSEELQSFPIMGFMEFLWRTRVARQVTTIRPLNYLEYDKGAAKRLLLSNYDWKDYGEKHSESRFTKFYQDIYLPKRFNFDKRRLHLSSLIVSGQISRDEALKILKTPIGTDQQVRFELKFIAKKLGVSVGELQELMDLPPKAHEEYPNQRWLFRSLGAARGLIQKRRRSAKGG